MYYNLWPDLLRLLKMSYLSESGITEEAFRKNDKNLGIKSGYYLKDYKQNLIVMPDKCHYEELDFINEKETFSYIASKRALAFNLFGNKETIIKENAYGLHPGRYQIHYMKKIPLLKSKNSNMICDTQLYNEEAGELIIVRVRFLEWIILNNEDIKETYLNSKYYSDNVSGSAFSTVLRNILPQYNGEVFEYSGCLYNPDIMYIIKALIAAYNIVLKAQMNIRKLSILDTYWKPMDFECLDQYAGRIYLKEKNIIKDIEELHAKLKPVSDMFLNKFSVSVEIKSIDIWNMMVLQEKTKEEIMWMKRFIV